MKRRAFLSFAAGVGAAMAWNVGLAGPDNPRVGLIGIGTHQSSQDLLDAFRDGLRPLGAGDGSITIVDRWAEGYGERLPSIASELIGSRVDILVTIGTPATLATIRTTTSLPIVFVGVGDPLASGIVDSLAHPGGNVTGLSLRSSGLIDTRLSLLRELLPGFRRLAVIVRNEPGVEQTLQDLRSGADRLGVKTVEFEATTGQSLRLAFMHMRND